MKFFRRCVYLLSVLLPLALLADHRAVFYNGSDWNYHLWLTAYFGEYFRHHFGMPTELNATAAVGMALPLFYGYLLYPFLGFFSTFLGAELALRLGCLLLVALQFYALLCAGRAVLRHRGLSYAVAVTVVWSTYALTNLYNRSAIPEYFATGFLMAAIGFVVAAAADASRERRLFHGWMAGVAALLATGVHPPTAVVSGVFLAAVGLLLAGVWTLGLRRLTRFEIGMGLGGTVFGALILSPLLYLTLRLGPKLAIWGDPYLLSYYPDRFDSWFARLTPLPFDWLSNRQGTVNVSTPYLEAPIAFGLLLLVGWLLLIWLRAPRPPALAEESLWTGAARWIVWVALGWFGFLLTLSLSTPLATHFLFLGPYLQYAYRLVSHANAALLIAVFASGALAHRSGALSRRSHQADVVAAVCIAAAALSVMIKLEHGSAVAVDQVAPEYVLGGDRAPLIANPNPYLVEWYTTPAAVSELNEGEARGATAASFPVGREGSEFGQVGDAQVQLDRPAWVVTNALVFPWSRIWVNGVRWGGDELRRRGPFLAVRLPAGTARLHWEWHPDPIWFCFHAIGEIAFALVMLITVFWLCTRGVGGLRHRPSSD